MKAEINKKGALRITAETIPEAFALKHLFPIPIDICNTCGAIEPRVPQIIDCSILDNDAFEVSDSKTEDKNKRIKDLLYSLFAIIHRDGGQYADKHGLEKAYDDAVSELYRLRRNEEG